MQFYVVHSLQVEGQDVEGQQYRKINPEILLPVSSRTKKLCPKNGTSFLVQVFGTGFWCVCHWHNITSHNQNATDLVGACSRKTKCNTYEKQVSEDNIVRSNVRQVLLADMSLERSLAQDACRVVQVLNISDRQNRILHSEVNVGTDFNCRAVRGDCLCPIMHRYVRLCRLNTQRFNYGMTVGQSFLQI